MAKDGKQLPSERPSTDAEVKAFLDQVATIAPTTRSAGARGRLIFAMDATASRQPMWDRAARIQGEMFQATAALGGLDIQLVFYRGFGEFKVSRWTANEAELMHLMTSVFCMAGETQVRKVLVHAANEARQRKVNALVFVGDAFEEDIDAVGTAAGELGLLGVPTFMFHEGGDSMVAFAFQQVAKLSGGAYCRFDASSPDALKNLLSAVAVYAAGGNAALKELAKKQGGEALKIAHQITKG
jgi:hypothetical protein